METREPEYHSNAERSEPDHSTRHEGVRIFEADAWIPMWEQSTPGKKIVLGSVPTSCNLNLEPEPHFAIDVNLEGEVALEHHRPTLRGTLPIIVCNFTPNIPYWIKDSGHFG